MAVKQFAPLQVVSMKGWKISFNTPGIMKGALTVMTTWETRVQATRIFTRAIVLRANNSIQKYLYLGDF